MRSKAFFWTHTGVGFILEGIFASVKVLSTMQEIKKLRQT